MDVAHIALLYGCKLFSVEFAVAYVGERTKVFAEIRSQYHLLSRNILRVRLK